MNIRKYIRQQIRRTLMQEGGTLQAEKKPDVLGLFDGLVDIGQEFTYLVQLMREASDNDAYIMGRLNQIIDEYVKTGNVEQYHDAVRELEKTIRENF